METKALSTADEFQESIKTGVTLVDFSAPWCGPCRAQEPINRQLAEMFLHRATIAEMNIDNNQDTAIQLEIKSIPTLALYKDGKEVRRFVGVQSLDTLSRVILESLG